MPTPARMSVLVIDRQRIGHHAAETEPNRKHPRLINAQVLFDELQNVVEQDVIGICARVPGTGGVARQRLRGKENGGFTSSLRLWFERVVVFANDIFRARIDPVRGVEEAIRFVRIVVSRNVDDVLAFGPTTGDGFGAIRHRCWAATSCALLGVVAQGNWPHVARGIGRRRVSVRFVGR